MKKFACLVVLAASLSYGAIIEIDIPVPENGWDHKNATLAKVHLSNYLNANETIESAVLQFTGIQNLREPETDDILNISLLQLNGATGADVQLSIFQDGKDNEQFPSNFFKVSRHSSYTWVNGLSNLQSYTDNNDNFNQPGGSYLESLRMPENTQEVGDGWYYVRWVQENQWYGYGLWQRIRNYKTENFNRVLDVAVVEQLMSLSNGWLGIGLDADCHYMGNVKLVVTTTTTNVPEPGSFSLMILGLTSLTGALMIRRRRK